MVLIRGDFLSISCSSGVSASKLSALDHRFCLFREDQPCPLSCLVPLLSCYAQRFNSSKLRVSRLRPSSPLKSRNGRCFHLVCRLFVTGSSVPSSLTCPVLTKGLSMQPREEKEQVQPGSRNFPSAPVFIQIHFLLSWLLELIKARPHR